MKIFKVTPGVVLNAGQDGWKYTYTLLCAYIPIQYTSTECFATPNAAKQAMRERVALLRKQHCL